MIKKSSLPVGTKIPNHLAIIPDGNRRWAREKGLPILEGHRRGFKAGIKIARTCRSFGIHTLTFWAFSTENWERTKKEVAYLMKLYYQFLDQYLKEAKKDEVRIIHLGIKDRIEKSLLEKIKKAEEETKNNKKHIFNLALNYGGHDEIIRAINRLCSNHPPPAIPAKPRVSDGVSIFSTRRSRLYRGLSARPEESSDLDRSIGTRHELTEREFSQYLDTAGQPYPYPDLMIRTSGELRTSGLLLWQSAYTEFYFEKDYFPDITPDHIKKAVLSYSDRQRRFGK